MNKKRTFIAYQHVPQETDSSSGTWDRSVSLLDMSFRRLAIGTALLPLTGFLFSVFWSLVAQFDLTTATHCNVSNLLPSLSAATGSFMPQKAVWKASISLHTGNCPFLIIVNDNHDNCGHTVPRIIVFIAYYTRHKSGFVFLLNLMEVTSLLGLALFGSNENYPIHSKCFGTFLVTSLMYMFLASYTDLFYWCRRTLRTKTLIAWLNLVMMISATYFFFRHNNHCEPYVYTLFALSEYVIVLSNIYFHTLAYSDLGHLRFSIVSDERKDSQSALEIA